MLLEDRTHRHLEGAPAARNTKSFFDVPQPGERRVGAQRFCDDFPIRVEIEHRADSLNDEKERVRIAKVDADAEGVLLGFVRNGEIAGDAVHRKAAAVTVAVDRFDAGREACREELQNALPVVWRAVVKVEEISILQLAWSARRE